MRICVAGRSMPASHIGLHEGIMFERMIQDLYADLEAPTCPAWEHDSE